MRSWRIEAATTELPAVDRRYNTPVNSAAMSTTMRVTERTRERFSELAAATGRPMTELVEEAVDRRERRIFFDQLDDRWGELQRDPEAWAEIERECQAEEGSLRDGIE